MDATVCIYNVSKGNGSRRKISTTFSVLSFCQLNTDKKITLFNGANLEIRRLKNKICREKRKKGRKKLAQVTHFSRQN